MSIAQSGGPHTVYVWRKSTTYAANKSPIDGFTLIGTKTCFVAPLAREDIDELAKKGILVNAMITFFTDPGAIDEKTLFVFTNNGIREIHECVTFADECNLHRVYVAHTRYKTGNPKLPPFATPA
jgi:hypothetical protein